MSAAEKLQNAAPWDQWREYTNHDVLDLIETDDMDRLLNALPQIEAVVALAEGIAQTDAAIWGTRDGLGFKLQNALAALDEALS